MDLISPDYVVRSPFPSIPYPKCDLWQFYLDSFTRNADSVALINPDDGTEITFGQLRQRAETVAANLVRQGHRREVTLTICMTNCAELLVMVFAVWRLGGSVAFINHLLSDREILKALLLLESDTVFCDASTAGKVFIAFMTRKTKVKRLYSKEEEQLPGCIPFSRLLSNGSRGQLPPPAVNPEEDTAVIFFSSGTTGEPKAVQLTHSAVVQQNTFTAYTIDLHSYSGGSIIYQPLSHVYGFVMTLLFILSGKPNVILKQFDMDKYFSLVAKYRVEFLFMVPPTAVRFCKSGLDRKYSLKHIKVISIGGAPISVEVENELKRLIGGHVKVVQGYGMTELTSGCIRVPPYNLKIPSQQGSIGWTMPNTYAKIIDLSNKQNLGPNQTGEICIKCGYMMKNYLKNPEATVHTIDTDGWLHTGDIGYYNTHGCFFIVDRLKELIKYKGYQVSPSELEGVLLTHPAVADAGVTSVPDPEAGELPFAWIQLKQGTHETKDKEIQSFINKKVAPFKRLRGGIKFVDSIPKSASGKILRRMIKHNSGTNTSKL